MDCSSTGEPSSAVHSPKTRRSSAVSPCWRRITRIESEDADRIRPSTICPFAYLRIVYIWDTPFKFIVHKKTADFQPPFGYEPFGTKLLFLAGLSKSANPIPAGFHSLTAHVPTRKEDLTPEENAQAGSQGVRGRAPIGRRQFAIIGPWPLSD